MENENRFLCGARAGVAGCRLMMVKYWEKNGIFRYFQ
jgi:hypothetical protein